MSYRSIEDLAVEAFQRHQELQVEAELHAEEQRRIQEEESLRLKSEVMKGFKERYKIAASEAFAKRLGIAPNDPLLWDLSWTTESEEWPEDVQDLVATGREMQLSDLRCPNLYVTVGDVDLQVSGHELLVGNVAVVRWVRGGSSGPVNSLADLGQLIIEERRRGLSSETC